MNTGEIVLLVYLIGFALIYIGMGIWNEKPDVKLWHLLVGPFNGEDDGDKVGLLAGLVLWPLSVVTLSVLWVVESKAWPGIKKIWKVVVFPYTVLVWVLNIRLWPLRKVKK